MEIQKIFSEIDTDEKLYSVLLNEDELALFSEIQKEFNSAAQKILRRASDYKTAMTGTGRLVNGELGQITKGMNSFGNNANSFINQGRSLNKSLPKKLNNINNKINSRAGLTSAI